MSLAFPCYAICEGRGRDVSKVNFFFVDCLSRGTVHNVNFLQFSFFQKDADNHTKGSSIHFEIFTRRSLFHLFFFVRNAFFLTGAIQTWREALSIFDSPCSFWDLRNKNKLVLQTLIPTSSLFIYPLCHTEIDIKFANKNTFKDNAILAGKCIANFASCYYFVLYRHFLMEIETMNEMSGWVKCISEIVSQAEKKQTF